MAILSLMSTARRVGRIARMRMKVECRCDTPFRCPIHDP